jgi:RNA polymerase sigma-70 factor (ECF subfamily)
LQKTTPHDVETLLSAREGDNEAGRALVERHGPSMVRTAWSVLGRYGGHDADDVVQEAFVAVLTTSAMPAGEDVGAWLRAITVRKALDALRRSARRREQSLPGPDEHVSPPVAVENPATMLDVLTVRKGLARLTPIDRAILVLVDLEGHSMRAVARLLGLTRVAVKLRASRARRRLAGLLGPGGRNRSESKRPDDPRRSS